MSMVFAADGFGLDAEQAGEGFPENQNQLIGIEARVFDDLAPSPNLPAPRKSNPPTSPKRFNTVAAAEGGDVDGV